jgi:hypothetical protein
MRKAFVAFFVLAVGAGLASVSYAQDNIASDDPILRTNPRALSAGGGVFGTATRIVLR